MTFSGSGIKAVSIVFAHSEEPNPVTIREKLLKLRSDFRMKQSRTVIFMFGQDRKENWKIQSRICKEIFPGVEILGMLGNRQIGRDFNDRKEAENIHENETVLLFISFT